MQKGLEAEVTKYRVIHVVDPKDPSGGRVTLSVQPFLDSLNKNPSVKSDLLEIVDYWLQKARQRAGFFRTVVNLREQLPVIGEAFVYRKDGEELSPDDSAREERRQLQMWERSVTKLNRLGNYVRNYN